MRKFYETEGGDDTSGDGGSGDEGSGGTADE